MNCDKGPVEIGKRRVEYKDTKTKTKDKDKDSLD